MSRTANVSFLDLSADFRAVSADARRRIDAVLDSQSFVLGKETDELERWLVARTRSPFAFACSSGSDALYLALRALGIGPGAAVVVPSFTFFATAGAAVNAGARPIFADVDDDTLMIGPSQLEAALERDCEPGDAPGAYRLRGGAAAVRAVVPVHLYGAAADMRGLGEAARRASLAIVEDAAQALGAEGSDGPVGSWGDVGCFSFYPTKNLGGPGDGGAVVTANADTAERLGRLRVHGGAAAYEHVEVGINARMSELVAAVLNAKAVQLDAWIDARRRCAGWYRENLAGLAERERVRLPAPTDERAHVYHQFTVRVAHGRDEVQLLLAERGVESRVFYPRPLHLQPCFAEAGYSPGDLPVSEAAAREVLCLPIHPSLERADVDHVCDSLAAALDIAGSGR